MTISESEHQHFSVGKGELAQLDHPPCNMKVAHQYGGNDESGNFKVYQIEGYHRVINGAKAVQSQSHLDLSQCVSQRWECKN